MATKTTKEMTNTEAKDYLNEEVEIMLHKDDGRYKDDIVVILNGTALVVPRGEKVKIKRKYAKIIEQSLGQKAATAARISGNATPPPVSSIPNVAVTAQHNNAPITSLNPDSVAISRAFHLFFVA